MSETITIPKILLADDQSDVLVSLRLLLKGEGYQTQEAQSPAAVISAVKEQDFDGILMDMNYTRDTTSGQEGLDLLKRIREVDETLPVVVMTAWSSIELVVEAMKRGARDFIEKPWENARLLSILRTQIELRQALRAGKRLEAENRMLRGEGKSVLIAQSTAMRPVLEMIENIGPSDANVLILGENGTGKGVVTRALHAVSLRADKPLITVNVGGLAEGVFAGELFGHVKGAFTDAKTDRVGRFELADGGTLFLDEIANVPMREQPKLLRVLETGEFERVGSSRTRSTNVRIISATNADIQKEIEEERFRRDLLYRLNTVEIHLPPLRDRVEDIPLLAMHFLKNHAARYRKNVSCFDASAMEALRNYSWPGNVRELDHAVERAVLMAKSDVIQNSDLAIRKSSESVSGIEEMSLEEVESYLIKKAMARNNGNISQAAKMLGLSRTALYRRLEKYGI
ncbi:MAG: sigma-54-dependent Fis family transcriptional regulator [Candidatus Omnitrophota bacterium]|jgi:DNA-binding NtrC family response regulator|nr:MAG: sigma-54-dependent Fis family transcriptional regulator [Candidatus Omnitrophota bacterium]